MRNIIKCPICHGNGRWVEDVIDNDVLYTPCNSCRETGKVSMWYIVKYIYATRDWRLKGQ